MRFWDSSAVVPLLVEEATTQRLLAVLNNDPDVSVWWATPVECTAAITRREREGTLAHAHVTAAFDFLTHLSGSWREVGATDQVRASAGSLLRSHPLRAADALQLAAALVASGNSPGTLEFVCLDQRLNEAATREGLKVVP